MKERSSLPAGMAWGILGILTVFVWGKILLEQPTTEPSFYFLDVGQGDATLAILPGGVSILTDAGPDRTIVESMRRAVGKLKYIDLAIISHPQLDHFNGFNYLVETLNIGAFLVNGRDATGVEEWEVLMRKIRERKIPVIVVGARDAVRHASDSIAFLSPNEEYLQSAELNDTGLVEYIRASAVTALLSADIDSTLEKHLTQKFSIAAEILKVAHHGSKYSTSDEFLKAVRPRIAVIEAGKRNRYGHPAPETLARLASSTPFVFRTDRDGTIKIQARGKALNVFTLTPQGTIE